MVISLIAAHDKNLVIGADGTLPWHFKEDLAFFKRTTMGYPVLMGRGVFEELDEKPLPGRRNVILTRTRNYPDVEVEVCRSMTEALELLKDEEKIFVIGGGVVYSEILDQADELIITVIPGSYEGDTWFPEYRDEIGRRWKEVWREERDELQFLKFENVL